MHERVRHPASAVLLGIAVLFCARAVAAELARPAGLIREAVAIPFTRPDGSTLRLDAVVTRPVAPGRYPLVLVNHGSPRSAKDRVSSPARLTAGAIEFARRGWAAGIVARRGYGGSEGRFAEGYSSCENPDYQAAGLASAQDIVQSARFLQAQAYVDPGRLLLVGTSAGGFGALASASLSPPGLVGVINFAGGRGSRSNDSVCSEDRLIAAAAHYGKSVRVPTLWVYAANDHFFGPKLARAMFDAFAAAGAPGELIIAPPFGNDGHVLFSAAGIPRWRGLVDDFLRKHHLPTWAQPIAAPIPNLPPPLGANAKVAAEFERYRASQNYEKAFAFAGSGRFTWVAGRRSAADAVADAVDGCQQTGVTCKAYAINDALAEARRSGSAGPRPMGTR